MPMAAVSEPGVQHEGRLGEMILADQIQRTRCDAKRERTSVDVFPDYCSLWLVYGQYIMSIWLWIKGTPVRF